MNTLTLTEIAPYLPYGLQGIITKDIKDDYSYCDWVEDFSIFEKGAIWEYIGYANGKYMIPLGDSEMDGFIYGNGNSYASINEKRIKPILYPLSHLTKPMDDGRVPLIELANIAFPEMEWKLCEMCPFAYSNSGEFSFRHGNFYFEDNYGESGGIPNQLALFQELAKMKFDFMGLIDAGKAIDATTLPSNPYRNE